MVDEALERDRLGRAIPPQSTSTPVGLLIALTGLVIPIVVMAKSGQYELHPSILQRTPTFAALERAQLISVAKIAEFEWLVAAYVFLQAMFLVHFFKKVVSRFSESNRPPIALKDSWPRCIWGLLAVGLFGICFSLTFGSFAESIGYLSSKVVFLMLTIFALSTSFLMEGLLASALFLFLFFKYWRNPSTQ